MSSKTRALLCGGTISLPQQSRGTRPAHRGRRAIRSMKTPSQSRQFRVRQQTSRSLLQQLQRKLLEPKLIRTDTLRLGRRPRQIAHGLLRQTMKASGLSARYPEDPWLRSWSGCSCLHSNALRCHRGIKGTLSIGNCQWRPAWYSALAAIELSDWQLAAGHLCGDSPKKPLRACAADLNEVNKGNSHTRLKLAYPNWARASQRVRNRMY